jgi:hypothetical protein
VRVPCDGDDEIVATTFSLGSHDVRDPPHGRVIKEEALDQALEDVDQIIVAANVCQLMEQNDFDLSGRKTGEQSDRDED